MKFLGRLLLITILCYFVPFIAPWWIIFVIAFGTGYLIPGNNFNVFNSALLGGGIVWIWLAYSLDQEAGSMLSEKIVQLMPFDDSNYLILISGVIGGVCAGFGAVTGSSFRQIFMKKKVKSFYA